MTISDHIKRLVKNGETRTPVDHLLLVAGLAVIVTAAVCFIQRIFGQ